MIEILSFREQRILKICELLILNAEPISFNRIMFENECSLKTVYDDLKFLKTKYDTLIDITIDSSSVYSKDSSIAQLMGIRQSLFYNNLMIRVYAKLYFEGPQTMDDFVFSFHYSKSKIRKELVRCNKMLKTIKAKIEIDDGVYTLKAQDEGTLAYLASLVVLGSGYPENIYRCVDTLISQSTFEKERGINLPSVIKDEILLADSLMKQYRHCYNCPNYFQALPKGLLEDIIGIAKRHTEDFEDEQQICEKILRSLQFKMTTFKLQTAFHMQRYGYFYHQFKQENPQLILEYEHDIYTLEHKWKLPFSFYKEELFFLLYIHFPHLRNYQSYQIGVYSDLGKEHANMLINRAEKFFNVHKFEIYNNNKNYDLIISTSKHIQTQTEIKSKILTVSDFMSPQDYRDLYQALSECQRT